MKRLRRLAVWATIGILCGAASAGAAGPPPVGGPLPDFTLAVPKDGAERAYLGLAGSGSFRLPQVSAQAVVVEIFSMYCPYCQKEAPNVNRLYERIEGDPALKGKIMVIGIGAGNSSFEVNLFKKKYAIPFPLFPDAEFVIHKLVGQVRTPCFITVKLQPQGPAQVVHTRLGGFEAVEPFVAEIVRAAAVK